LDKVRGGREWGVFIIHRLTDNILDSTIGNIRYRNNIVTGVVATDNGNGTYDVYIAGADVAYPNVPTTMPEPDFSIDDPVGIAIEYGNKEMPIIIGHAQKVVQEFVEDVINVLVTTIGSHTIGDKSAYLDGRIEDIDGYENCIERGFYYGTTTGYGSEESSTGSFAAGSYSEQVTGLTAETTYHFQAYVHDTDNDVHIGEDKTVTTTTTPFTNKIYAAWEDTSNDVWLLQYGTTGNLLNTWQTELTENVGNPIAVDVDDNIYTVTGDQHSIKKRSSTGGLTLTKTETNWIYNIAAGPDGYIYTQQFNTGITNGYISKRNASDLVSVGTRSVGSINTYSGMTIDTDGKIYMVNQTQKRYETWDFIAGLEANSTGSIEYSFASLATVGPDLANIDWLAHAILLPKDYSDGGVGTDYELGTLDRPMNLGTMGSNYLAIGYTAGSAEMLIGKYNSSLGTVWETIVAESGWTSTVAIAAYPF